MSEARDYLVTVDRDEVEAERILHATAASLQNKQISLVEVIESLGDYINDENLAVRSKAVTYLGRLIEALPIGFLLRQQIQVLCQFFCDRIEDEGATKGLEVLIGLPRFSGEMAVATFRATIEHFQDLQLRTQLHRYQVLRLVDCILSKWRGAVRDLGSISLLGIADLVSGEKDPRNLMIIFSILQVVIFEWDVRLHAETLFDAVFCYFPITFRPPPNDPYGITAPQLKTRLRDCLAASRHMAPYVFPQLIDKLDSTSLNVKRDVLEAMVACIDSYDANTMVVYSIPVWDAVKYEILNAQDDDLVQGALFAVTGLAKRLDVAIHDGALGDYLRTVLQECLENLQDPEHKQAKSSASIVQACAEASPRSFSIVIREVVPALVLTYQDANSTEQRMALLEHISKVLDAAKYQTSAFPQAQLPSPLHSVKDQLFQMFSQALLETPCTEIPMQITAVRCLSRACEITGFLATNERGLVVQQLGDLLLNPHDKLDSSFEAVVLDTLVQISRTNAHLLMEITFPQLLARLPEAQPEDKSYYRTLEILSHISIEKEISNALVRRLFNRLEILIQGNIASEYLKALLSALVYVLDRQDFSPESDIDRHWQRTFRLLTEYADGAFGRPLSNCLNEIPVTKLLGQLSRAVLGKTPLDQQQDFTKQAYNLFREDSSTALLLWQSDWSVPRKGSIIIITYLIAAIDPSVPLPFAEESYFSVMQNLIELGIREETPILRKVVLQHLALVANKYPILGSNEWLKEVLLEPSQGLLARSTVSKQTLRVGTWISKALICRLQHVNVILLQYMDLFAHPDVGMEAARGFGTLLAQDEIFARENGATIRALTAQRMFSFCVPAISERYWAANPSDKVNHLIALAGLLTHVEKSIIILETSRLLPLLLSSLELEEQGIRSAALMALEAISLEAPSALEAHLSGLVSRFAAIAGDASTNTQIVRIQALQCLRALPEKLDIAKLLPYRRRVAQYVLIVLDDPRREVRKEAVNCRTAWSRLDDTEDVE